MVVGLDDAVGGRALAGDVAGHLVNKLFRLRGGPLARDEKNAVWGRGAKAQSGHREGGLQIDNLSSFVLHFDGLVDNDFCVELGGDAVS